LLVLESIYFWRLLWLVLYPGVDGGGSACVSVDYHLNQTLTTIAAQLLCERFWLSMFHENGAYRRIVHLGGNINIPEFCFEEFSRADSSNPHLHSILSTRKIISSQNRRDEPAAILLKAHAILFLLFFS
jgi:hypothetical protein